MYARITMYHCKRETLAEAVKMVENLKPEILNIPGLKNFFCTGNQDGNCALIGIYDSREAAEAAADTVGKMFTRFADYIDTELRQLGYEVLVHGTTP